MALVNGEWLDYEQRAQRIADLTEEGDLLQELIDLGIAVLYDIERMETILDELERLERVHRAERDVLYFGMTYASEDANPGNDDNLIPANINVANSAKFHRDLAAMLDDVVSGALNTNIAYAVPRGHAKTAWLSNIFVLHQIVYRHKKYIVLISETTDVAGDFIGWARFQLKHNQKLRGDFGEILHTSASKNELDNKTEFITGSGTKVEAKGLGTQMRGLRYGATRPDLFIMDDLESKESTNTPEMIEKNKRWFREEAINALAKGGLCIYLGTILCYDSLLDYVIRERKDFRRRKFAAVKSFATNTRLWEQWRMIYREDSEDAPERAREFYEAHEAEMLEGAEILWPGYWSYYQLMVRLEADGAKAFTQEFQNEPTDEERQVFKEDEMVYFQEDDVLHYDLEFYAGIDIAMGKSRTKGDYSVIATVAKNRATNTLYLWDLWVERAPTDVLIKEAVRLARLYQYERIGIEAAFGQEFVADGLGRALDAAGYPSRQRLNYIKEKTNKGIRIESMQPAVESGRLRFNERLRNHLDQFLMYPMHKHDDVPDATEMALKTARASGSHVSMVRNGLNRW